MAENRVKGRKVFDQFSLACNEYLGFKPRFAGAITRDPRVPDSIRAQTPLPTRHPQSQAYEDVIRIVKSLRDRGVAILVLSTEPETILTLADRVTVIRKGMVAREFGTGHIEKADLLAAA